MTSRSSRSAERSALANENLCGPTSRWLIRLVFLDSLEFDQVHQVRMWACSFSLTCG
jgi:hypothetical protein